MKKPPIIIRRGFWTSIWPNNLSFQKLEDEGFDIVSPPPSFLSLCNIHTQAFSLSKLIDKTLKKYKVDKINLIGISMGGVIGLYYLHHFDGAKKVNIFISICAPFHGTWIPAPGAFMFGPIFGAGAWEMLPTSRVLKELREKELPKDLCKFYAFSAKNDIIVPRYSAQHPQATRNICLSGGHADLCLARNEKIIIFISNLLLYES